MFVAAWVFVLTASVRAVAAEDEPVPQSSAAAPAAMEPLARVEVDHAIDDPRIANRLARILEATKWFQDLEVHVDEGVVFIQGRTQRDRYRDWAGDVARRTEGVVAVVNRIELTPRGLTDLGPALEGLRALWDSFLQHVPLMAAGIALVGLAYAVGRLSTWAARRGYARRKHADIVDEIKARAIGLVVFTLGVYIALRVAGLTRLAVTVLGGTGVFGLVLGIAFRDIVENVLASILLTRQQPFQRGDLVEIEGVEGIVQRLTLRATVLLSVDGNHVQIPNAIVYKSAIRNYTTSPARRIDFAVGIGYEESIARAQEIALAVIAEHPAILKTPEPLVLVESLGSAVVNLRVYVWLDGTKHSAVKVRSSAIRLVKRAYQEHRVSMPDEAREVVFPHPVPIALVNRREAAEASRAAKAAEVAPEASDGVATGAEAGLGGDSDHLEQLAAEARSPESGPDLLEEPRARSNARRT